MRFRITKNNDNSVYSIIVTGVLDEDAGWDLLQISQVMLAMPRCSKLIIDLRSALIYDDLSVFTTDILASVLEESLMKKDSSIIVRYHDNHEIQLYSDQLPLKPSTDFTSVSLDQAKFFGKAMKWLKQEARLLVN